MKNKKLNVTVLVLFFIAAGTIIVFKNSSPKGVEVIAPKFSVTTQVQLPKLLDLGSHSCVPCKMMMPILDTLRNVHAGKLEVEFIDVWQDREAGTRYDVRAIPTQIIYDETGEELFRHEGFWSREEMEEKMKELGIDLGGNS